MEDLGPPPPVWFTGSSWESTRWHDRGVHGLPILKFLPNFRETWSHMSCTLHVVCEGLLKQILDFMRSTPNLPHSFVKVVDRVKIDWKYYDAIQRKVRHVKEIDHLPPTLDASMDWKGVDYLNFLLYELPVLVSDEEIMTNSVVYETLVYLANSVYLMHHGCLDDEMIVSLEENVAKFAETYVRAFGESNCTWKFHIFQHFPLLVKIHGPAFLWDTFNGERLLGMLKKDVKSTRFQIIQASMAFLLRHQCKIFEKKPEGLSGQVVKQLKKIGMFKDDAQLATIVNQPMRSKAVRWNEIDPEEWGRVEACVEEELGISSVLLRSMEFCRVTQFRRRHVLFSSTFSKRYDGSVSDDSFISLDEDTFGRINDILWFPSRKVAIFDVRLYQKKRVSLKSGSAVLFPINQFAVERTNTFQTFVLKDDLHLRKIVHSRLRHLWWPEGVEVDVFGVRPNEWFHF